jgi:UDP-N-acetylmuramate dehydrogenase
VSRNLLGELQRGLPELRGRLAGDAPLADITWFRVGGPAEVLFTPADEPDLAYLLRRIDPGLPVVVLGLGSNVLVRDGGIRGVVVRLGRGFGTIAAEPGYRLVAGTGLPVVKLARAAAEAGIAGLAFYRGIPGSVGGALRMNAGAQGSETKDVLVAARALDRAGNVHMLQRAELDLGYRRCGAPPDFIFTQATFEGSAGDATAILAAMEEVAQYREAHQPIRERTGGSTFKNPPGQSAWRLIDAAGCRGLNCGDAKVSQMHCNFLINDGAARAEDLERLGETVRARVFASSGVALEWEIVRLGLPSEGRASGEALLAPAAP